jgi:hypothetical protein
MAKMIIPKEEKKDPLIHKKINRTAVNKDSIEGMTPEKDKKVTGTFLNVECPGQPAKICAILYKGMQYFSQVFEEGISYTIPLSVARFINERCQYEEHSYLTDEKGSPLKTNKYRSRYKFMIESMG